MLFHSYNRKQHRSVCVFIVCHFLSSQSWRQKWRVSWYNDFIRRFSQEKLANIVDRLTRALEFGVSVVLLASMPCCTTDFIRSFMSSYETLALCLFTLLTCSDFTVIMTSTDYVIFCFYSSSVEHGVAYALLQRHNRVLLVHREYRSDVASIVIFSRPYSVARSRLWYDVLSVCLSSVCL